MVADAYISNLGYLSLRSRRLEVAGERENGRARGRHACLLLARPFFLVPTTSKRLLRRLGLPVLVQKNSLMETHLIKFPPGNEAEVQLTRLENCLEIMQLNLLTRLEKCLEIMQLTLVIGWLALILSYIKNRTEPSCIHYSVPFRDAAKHSFQVVYRHFFISTMVRTYSSSEPLPAIISTTCRSFVFLSQLTVLTFFFCANFSCLQRPPVINGNGHLECFP